MSTTHDISVLIGQWIAQNPTLVAFAVICVAMYKLIKKCIS